MNRIQLVDNSRTDDTEIVVNRMPCPMNEFSEICTADMESMNTAYHAFLQPKYEKQFKKWRKNLDSK